MEQVTLHHGGIEGLFQRVGRRKLPLMLHPAVWRDRKVVFPTGVEIHMPAPSHNDLDREGVTIIEERGPLLLLDDMVLVTGQVERVTDFEKGFPLQQARTSCSHTGVINVLRHAQRLTGIDTVYAFVGGLHLTGGLFEAIIPRTLAELAAIGPAIVVPGHCTGWKATNELARKLPEAYIQTSVGTRLHFALAEGFPAFPCSPPTAV